MTYAIPLEEEGSIYKEVIVKGIREDGELYGSIEAFIQYARKPASEIKMPFGRYTDRVQDQTVWVGSDKKVYNNTFEFRKACKKEKGLYCLSVRLNPLVHNGLWEVFETTPAYIYETEASLYEQFNIVPQQYSLSFKGFPTLSEIDALWVEILKIGGRALTVLNDVVVLKLDNDTYVPFDSLQKTLKQEI